MAFKKISIAGFSLSVLADNAGIGFSFSYNGALWKNTVTRITGEAATIERSPGEASPAPPASDEGKDTIAERVAKTHWYHSFDFGDGLKAHGVFDHGPILDKYKLPEDLSGKRVLDVAAFDGFWAFELEKRGASEVYALDLQRPTDVDLRPDHRAELSDEDLDRVTGRGFGIAKELLNSKVERVICNVYDLSPERFGTFDVVHAGDFLLHLTSPVKALQNIASVCDDYALISDVYSPSLDHMGERSYVEYKGGKVDVIWWKVSRSALQNMILDAGFSRVELLADFRYGPPGEPDALHHAVFKAYK